MSSTSNTSSSLSLPSPIALTHTLNSRGDLGMFVNPHACSCSTCDNYLNGTVDSSQEEPASNAFAILSAIGEAAIQERQGDPHEELASLIEDFEIQWRAAGGGTLRSPSLGGTSTTWYLGAMLEQIQDRRAALGLEEYHPPMYQPLARPGIGNLVANSSTIQPSTLLKAEADRCPAYGCENPLNCACPRAEPRALDTEDNNKPSRFRGYGWMGRRPPTTSSESLSRVASSFGKQATEPAVSNTTLQDMYDEMRNSTPKKETSVLRSSLPPPPPLVRVGRFTDASTTPSLNMLNVFTNVDEDDTMDRLRSLRSQFQLRQDDLYSGCSSHDEMAAADQEFNELDRKIHAIEQCMSAFGAIYRNR